MERHIELKNRFCIEKLEERIAPTGIDEPDGPNHNVDDKAVGDVDDKAVGDGAH